MTHSPILARTLLRLDAEIDSGSGHVLHRPSPPLSMRPYPLGEDQDRASFIATLIPKDIDLDVYSDVVVSLLRMRACSADFMDWLDEAIDIARDRRAEA